MNRNKKTLLSAIIILIIFAAGICYGYDYCKIKNYTPVESSQNVKITINDDGEVLLRTKLQYIKTDKSGDIIIHK